MAIFQFWNSNHFQNPISISRGQVMRVSKISSNGTYHKCIKDLSEYGYLEYFPSFNPYKGSLVHLFNLAPEEEDLSQENGVKAGENLLLFDLNNEPIIIVEKDTDDNKIQSGEILENKVIHTKNQTGYTNFNLTKIETSTVQALIPSINVINVINKKDKHKKENDFLQTDFSKKIIPDVDKQKEKSCAKKDKETLTKKATSGDGVSSKKAPHGDGVKAPSGIEVKAPSGVWLACNIIPTLDAVLEYFILKKYATIEAEKFFNYFQSNGWLVGGKTKMKDWNAAARNWILNAKSYSQSKPAIIPVAITSNLQVIKNKNYNEPL
jgi:hypothetical protein